MPRLKRKIQGDPELLPFFNMLWFAGKEDPKFLDFPHHSEEGGGEGFVPSALALRGGKGDTFNRSPAKEGGEGGWPPRV